MRERKRFAPRTDDYVDRFEAVLADRGGSLPTSGELRRALLRILGTLPSSGGGGALTDGDYGDIVVSGGGTAMEIDVDVITDAEVNSANKDGVAATPSMRTLGTGATQACAGNDARLSDARTPTAHTHPESDIVGLVADLAALFALAHAAATVVDTDTVDLTLTGQQIQADAKKQMSITSDASGLKLVNDAATPGASMLYGTNPGGDKGWYAQAAGSAPDIKAATITATYGVTEYSEVVVDAACTTTSQVMVSWGSITDDDENSPAFDNLTFRVVPDTGAFTIHIASVDNEPFGGPFKLNYLIG